MYLARTALVVGFMLCNVVGVKEQENVTKTEEDEDKGNDDKVTLSDYIDNKDISGDEEHDLKDTSLIHDHSFVPLIDIVFTDESKRTCTGAIIHDNVVITAAHCFKSKPKILPELTASFVVIGTRVMFETGYEQYLPIERVITHPMFKGWTADLSLVYTFAGMTSDKPGTIIPLGGEKTTTHVDTNVTVLSWGYLRNYNNKFTKQVYDQNKASTLAGNARSSRESYETKSVQENVSENDDEDTENPRIHLHMNIKEVTKFYKLLTTRKRPRQVPNKKISYPNAMMETVPNLQRRPGAVQNRNPQINQREHLRPRPHLVNQMRRDRALETNNTFPSRSEYREASKGKFNNHWSNKKYSSTSTHSASSSSESKTSVETSDGSNLGEYDFLTVEDKPKLFNFKKYYANWRRQMGAQENKLTADTFAFVNIQLCKKLVQNAMPIGYDFSKNNDIICYRTTSDSQIGDEDAGALAIRSNRLVAVTIAAAYHEGDYIAIGMKMSCYCSWITENLPKNDKTYKCCKDCCGVTNVMEETLHKKKYLYKFI